MANADAVIDLMRAEADLRDALYSLENLIRPRQFDGLSPGACADALKIILAALAKARGEES